MKYVNEKHKAFYEKKIDEYKRSGGSVDCYSKAVLYLLGICEDTRRNLKTVFDVRKHVIVPEGLEAGWQTGTSMKICRLAFNLWNGSCEEIDYEDGEYKVSKYYVVDNIFCCEYMEYFFEAVRLRYYQYIDK